MSFEQDLKGGCISESSPSLIHEAVDHVRNTWSKVLSGKGSTQDYAEVALEATAVVAASALAFKGGMKLFSAESRVGVSASNPELLARIREATKGDPGGFGRKMTLGPNGLPYVAAESRVGARVADPELLARIREAARGDLAGVSKKGVGPSGFPLTSKDLKMGSFNHEIGYDAKAFRLPTVDMKSITPPKDPDGIYRLVPPRIGALGAKDLPPITPGSFYRGVGPRIDAPGAKLLQAGKSAAEVAISDHRPLVVRVRLPGAS